MFDDADSFPVNRKDTYLGPNPSYWKKCSSMRNDLSEPEMDIEEIEVVTKSLIQNDSLIPNQVSAVAVAATLICFPFVQPERSTLLYVAIYFSYVRL